MADIFFLVIDNVNPFVSTFDTTLNIASKTTFTHTVHGLFFCKDQLSPFYAVDIT